MQEKVCILINLTEKFIAQLKCNGVNALCEGLSISCLCLKSHDLTGLDIIYKSMKESLLDSINDKNLQENRSEILRLIIEIKQNFDKEIVPLKDAEVLFLNISYNKFYDIFSEIYTAEFWAQPGSYRLSKISQAFSIYSEIITHEPFEGVFKWLSKYRPPMESEISNSLFRFIRNILAHFPFYDSWDEIWINKELVNWRYKNQSIDKFLNSFSGRPPVKYRFKERAKNEFTYITINFPVEYGNNKIFLKDIIQENEGVKFALVMMQRVLNTQIESITE